MCPLVAQSAAADRAWATLDGRRASTAEGLGTFREFAKRFDWAAFAREHAWAREAGSADGLADGLDGSGEAEGGAGESGSAGTAARVRASLVQRWVVYDSLGGPRLFERQLGAWVRANVPQEMRTEAMTALDAFDAAETDAAAAAAGEADVAWQSRRMAAVCAVVMELAGEDNAKGVHMREVVSRSAQEGHGAGGRALAAAGAASRNVEALLHDLDILDARRATDSPRLPGEPGTTLGDKLRRVGLFPPMELSAMPVPAAEETVRDIGVSERVARDAEVDPDGRVRAIGRRKEASASVHIWPAATLDSADAEDYAGASFTVNGKPYDEYFTDFGVRAAILQPLVFTRTLGLFDVDVRVKGGGRSGQAGAVRHGLSRALAAYEPRFFRWVLKRRKMITRDPRVVEPKKAGRVKARKRPTWVKR